MSDAAPKARLNLTVFWMAAKRRYLLVISRAVPRSELSAQLDQQIRARLMAEADATEMAQQLRRANRDLEEFASIISHDLRAPMRAMRYMVEDLEKALAGRLDADQARALAQVREQSQRMSAMLRALFEYSSAGHKRQVAEVVDTRALIDAIGKSMPRRKGLVIAIDGAWPTLKTLGAPLDLVLRNLIDNAVKHHDRAKARIDITAQDAGETIEITVVDDGPGIALEHQDAVFQPFRKLSNHADPESSGMGLALVKRTLEAAGGRLALTSDPTRARGAEFRVIWPKAIGD